MALHKSVVSHCWDTSIFVVQKPTLTDIYKLKNNSYDNFF